MTESEEIEYIENELTTKFLAGKNDPKEFIWKFK